MFRYNSNINHYSNQTHINPGMQVLLSMRIQTPRSRTNSLFILNLFALQFLCLISIHKLQGIYLRLAELILIFPGADGRTTSPMGVYVHFGLNMAVLLVAVVALLAGHFEYRQNIIRMLGLLVLNFKYVLMIPTACVNVLKLVSAEEAPVIRVLAGINLSVSSIVAAFELYSNWSNSFVEKDFCNRRENSVLCLVMQVSFAFAAIIFGDVVATVFLIAISLFRVYQVAKTIEYSLIQTSTLFYFCFNVLFCIMLLGIEPGQKFESLALTFKLVVIAVVSKYFSKQAAATINTYYGSNKNLYRFSMNQGSLLNNEEEKLSLEQYESKETVNEKDLLVVSRVLLSSLRMAENGKDQQWPIWWQKYNMLVVLHKLSCVNEKCECKESQDKSISESKMIIEDMKRLANHLWEVEKSVELRIMLIYLYVEIANKPLKGYYEIIKMKSEQIGIASYVDLERLIIETRECFNRIFIINNIQNSNLPLLKILRFEELLTTLELRVKSAIEATINFIDMFTLSSVKVAQVVHDSRRIFAIKQDINHRLEDLVVNYPDSMLVNFFIFIFYQYIEVYRSKEKEFKIISQEKNLKRRLFEKEDQDIFSTDYGVIYIDLVEERGKIKKITKNICRLYGHNYEDMVSFNINQFMPRIFGVNHYKFLANFIERGKIKILGDKRRVLFAKSKKKFIFPIIARLRTEHLLNSEFGVTALIRKEATSSEWIMFGSNGKIEEISEKAYEKMFFPIFRSEVDKIRRTSLYKMVPNLVRVVTDISFDTQNLKTHESLLIFANAPELAERFRLYREGKGGSSVSSLYANSMSEAEQISSESVSMNAGASLNYLADTFKSFLSDLVVSKLECYNITYRVSKIKTEEFTLLLLEMISMESIEQPTLLILEEYKLIADYLSIYEDKGVIDQHFDKLEREYDDQQMSAVVLDRVSHSKLDVRPHQDRDRKRLTIIKDEGDDTHMQNHSVDNIMVQSESQDLNDMANEFLNQQQFGQRAGSERSSVTEQSLSQTKKQMLINAFSSKNIGINKKFVVFINALIFINLGILVGLVANSAAGVQGMDSVYLEDVLALEINGLYNFRMANSQIEFFYNFRSGRNISIQSEYRAQLLQVRKTLNQRFTNKLLRVSRFYSQSGEGSSRVESPINIYDTFLNRTIEVSFLQLINELQFRFRTAISNESWHYLQENYYVTHRRLGNVSTQRRLDTADSQQSFQRVLIIFGVYEVMLFFIVLSWIPVLYLSAKEEKKILNLLSTMNLKQLRKAVKKLKFLYDNAKLSKANQMSNLLSLLSDDKVEIMMEMENEKTTTRSIRLIYEAGSQSIKPRQMILFMTGFLVFFSLLPLSFYFNESTQNQSFKATLRLIEQTFLLADKAPTLVNIYLTNINNIYGDQPIRQFPAQFYAEPELGMFRLTELVSQVSQSGAVLVQSLDSTFTDNICSQIECSGAYTSRNINFYDSIVEVKNKLTMLEPSKLNITGAMDKDELDSWAREVEAELLLSWVNKIYLFASSWADKFKADIEGGLKQAMERLIVMSCILLPFYVAMMVCIELQLLRKMSGILREAESIHMHFPVHILAENTYLTSYFNDKIKNSK